MILSRLLYAGSIVLIPLALYLFVLSYRILTRGRLDNASVKYAIDHLPMGILFYREDGRVILVNQTMQTLSRRFMKRSLLNGNDFHGFLIRPPADGSFKVSGDSGDFLVSADDEVWVFQRSEMKDGRDRVFQLIAYDTTELNAREMELSEKVILLNNTNEHLKQYREQVDILAENEAYLAAKERIHDSLGQVLLATRYYLTEPDAMLGGKDLIASWQKTIDELMRAAAGESTGQEKASFLKPLRDAAKALGANLIVNGEIPEGDVRLSRLVLSSARVCIINAVRHGGADEITIDFDERMADGMLTFTIGNNGRTSGAFTEGGGLKSLRTNVENEGGTVRYETSPRFSVIITVPCVSGDGSI